MFALRQRILSSATSRSLFYPKTVQTNASCVSLAIDRMNRRTVSATATTFDPNPNRCLVGTSIDGNPGIERVAAAAALPTPSSAFASTAVAVASNWFVMNNNPWNLITNALWNKEDGIFRISTLKRRRKMMNKHKLRKRRKKNRMKNKK